MSHTFALQKILPSIGKFFTNPWVLGLLAYLLSLYFLTDSVWEKSVFFSTIILAMALLFILAMFALNSAIDSNIRVLVTNILAPFYAVVLLAFLTTCYYSEWYGTILGRTFIDTKNEAIYEVPERSIINLPEHIKPVLLTRYLTHSNTKEVENGSVLTEFEISYTWKVDFAAKNYGVAKGTNVKALLSPYFDPFPKTISAGYLTEKACDGLMERGQKFEECPLKINEVKKIVTTKTVVTTTL